MKERVLSQNGRLYECMEAGRPNWEYCKHCLGRAKRKKLLITIRAHCPISVTDGHTHICKNILDMPLYDIMSKHFFIKDQ